MTTGTNASNTAKVVRAKSHAIVRMTSKRLEQSPYIEKYADDKTIFGYYCNRLYPASLGGDVIEEYWKLRHEVMLYDVPEKPLDIKGPDAVALLERVFTRRIDNLRIWRGRYAIACAAQGGMLMDGVLIRMAEDHFWYVLANGEFETWLLAHSEGLDVTVSDPRSRVLQIQGPKSLAVLNTATNGRVPDNFGYFHAGMLNFAGQEALVSRTGWTGEMGIEIYSNSATDHHSLWDHIMDCGKAHGMAFGGGDSMQLRRVESGILDYGTDIDRSMTPYDAGLSDFVDLSKPGFIGRDALVNSNKNCLLFGLTCSTGIPHRGSNVLDGNKVVGRMTVGDWSPTLEKGIGYVRFNDHADEQGSWQGQSLRLCNPDGELHDCEIVPLPFYDTEKKIPRGLEAEV